MEEQIVSSTRYSTHYNQTNGVDLHDRGGEGARYGEAVTNNEGTLFAIVFGQQLLYL